MRGEDRWAILGNVFVEQDASPYVAQQSRQRSFAIEEGSIVQILAVVLDQIECVEDCGPRGLPTAQLVEARQSAGAQYNRLAVDREALGLDPPQQRRLSLVVVQSSHRRCGCRAARRGIPPDDHPVAVILDFVDPIGARGRS